ncbi:MAG TPA: hypothetical protein PKZ32_00915 [Candidatus Melainabacteria bacterium]|nr:hypothetical protein [Candidatus Melainabacteria bacterium]
MGFDSLVCESAGRQQHGRRAVLELILFAAVLLCAMLIEFGATLRSYFTSDDLVLVRYVYAIFNGDPGLLLRMFTTAWMPDSTQEIFYRPLVEASYALDFLFSRTNPLGYHISNFLYSFVAAIALASLASSLCARFEFERPAYIGYAAAFLFALSPLHTEVTTWIVGRVDGLSTMFYLISLALFLKIPRRGVIRSVEGWLSIFAFLLGLLSKEMTFTLPFVVFLLSLFSSCEPGLPGKLRCALRGSLPYFLVLMLFLPLRALAIGSFFGGYVGALGEAMHKPLLESLMKLTHLAKAFYPYNGELIGSESVLPAAFHIFYGLTAMFVVARLKYDRLNRQQIKLVCFLLCFLVLQYLPLLQVFRLSDTLAGARLFYLSTALLAMILSILLVPGKQKDFPSLQKFFRMSGGVLLLFLSVLFVITGRINNQAWLLSGMQTLELQKQIKSVVDSLPENKKLLIAYLPSQIFGAFLFNRYYVLEALLSAPLSSPDIAERVCLLEPRFYLYDMMIPSGILRRRLQESNKYRAMFWNVDTCKLVDIERIADDHGEDAPVKQESLPRLVVDTRDGLESIQIKSERAVKPGAVRFVEMELENSQNSDKTGNFRRMYLRFEDKPEPPHFMDYWSSAPYDTGLSKQILRFPVDEVFSWYLLKERSHFQMTLGSRGNFKISGLRFLDGRDLIPRVFSSIDNLALCNDGVERPLGFPLKLAYDVSNIEGARGCIVELSRPWMMFQLEDYTYRSSHLSKKSLKVWNFDGTTGSIVLERSMFPQKALYQMRIFAKSAEGEIVGTSSDVIYVGIDDRPQKAGH